MKFRLSLILFFIFALVLVVGSLSDEALSPETRAALKREPAKTPPMKNAFVGLVGFHVAETADFMEAGHAFLQKTTEEKDFAEYPHDLFPTEPYKNPCFDAKEKLCLAKLAQDAGHIENLLDENKELVRRYRIIQEMPLYANTHPSMEIVPRYSGVMKISHLLGSAAFLEIRKGNINEGLDFIEKDVDFYKKIFTGKDATLIDTMVAVKKIGEYILGLSRLIEAEALDLDRYGDRLRRILAPLPDPVKYVANALETGDIYNIQTLSELPVSLEEKNDSSGFGNKIDRYYHKTLLSLFYKKNMTMNRMVSQNSERIRQIRDIKMRHLPSLVEKYREEMEKAWTDEVDPFNIFLLYQKNGIFFWKNYVGEVLLGIAAPDPMTYLTKACDTAVFMNLVRAQLELASLKEKPENLSGVRAEPEILNPYTETPFPLDRDKNVLWFEKAGKAEERRMEVTIPFSSHAPDFSGKAG